MIDSTPSGAVVNKRPALAPQLVVEADAGGKTEEALQYPLGETLKGAGPVTFQGEDVLAGEEDGLDALTDGGEMQRVAGLVFTQRTGEYDFELPHRLGELPPSISLVADEDVSVCREHPSSNPRPTSRSSRLGEVRQKARGVPSKEKMACRRNPQK